MKKGIDFESLYKTEFLDESSEDKNVLGITPPLFYFFTESFLGIVVFLILYIFMTMILVALELHIYITLAIIMIFIVFGGVFIASLDNRNTCALKERTLPPIIKAIYPTFRYKYKNYIPEKIFKASKISNKRIISYAGNDLVMGKIGGNYIMFSDLLVKSFTQTIFHGQFIVTEFNKNFAGTTVVSTDNAELIFGKVLGGFIQSGLSDDGLVRMDNTEFEESFIVHSTDSVEAHYILSPSLMERILSYKEKTKQLVEFSFFDNVVCIAISYNKDHFENFEYSDRSKSVKELKEAYEKEFTQSLALVTDIIEELKLNEKLWSKR